MEQMTVEQVIDITIGILEGISLPVGMIEQVGIPVSRAVSNLKQCAEAMNRARETHEQAETSESATTKAGED